MRRSGLALAALVAVLASIPRAATVSAAAPPDAPRTTSPFALAFVEGGRAHVVLDPSPDLTEATSPEVRSLEDPVVVASTPRRLSSAAATWLGRRVRLYGATGALCEGVVGDVALVGRVSPHEATTARLQGRDDEAPPLSPAEVASEAWSIAAAADAVVLAGEVDAVGCEGAVWAGPADVPAPAFVLSEAADAATEHRALAAFRALPSWAAVEDRYRTDVREDRAARWDSHGESRPTVNVIALGDGSRFVIVTADVGGGCGDFGASATAVFREDARGLTLTGPPAEESFVPTAAVDVDGDGALDLVLPTGVRRARGGAFEHGEALRVPFLGCPC